MEIEQLYEVFKQHPIITTDSRECPEGSLFFALKGASFNGNQFAQKALEKGLKEFDKIISNMEKFKKFINYEANDRN